MKRSPVENRIGKCDHVFVKHNHFLSMYSMIVEDEILFYNIYLNSDLNQGFFVLNENDITTREQADEYFETMTMRIEMKRRGICLN